MKLIYFSIIIFLGFTHYSCQNNNNLVAQIDIQGHRGCRGLMPENTIPGFIRALEMGVNTLEMDVCTSKDDQVIVSHDPFFHHHIATGIGGVEITEDNEKSHNLYQLDYSEIIKYDVGLKPHPNFPIQRKIPAIKPLLSNVIATVEAYCKEHQLAQVQYSIELKRKPENDGTFHAPVADFVDYVLQVVDQLEIVDRIILQCFDIETLQIIREKAPHIKLAYLIENAVNYEENIKKLGFIPEIYSPAFKLIDAGLVKYCNEHQMKLIPWTVNNPEDITRMFQIGVHGLISDYPDRAIEIYEGLQLTQQ